MGEQQNYNDIFRGVVGGVVSYFQVPFLTPSPPHSFSRLFLFVLIIIIRVRGGGWITPNAPCCYNTASVALVPNMSFVIPMGEYF